MNKHVATLVGVLATVAFAGSAFGGKGAGTYGVSDSFKWSEGSLANISDFSAKISDGSFEYSVDLSKGVSNSSKNSVKVSGELSVVGFHKSDNSATVVLAPSRDASQWSGRQSEKSTDSTSDASRWASDKSERSADSTSDASRGSSKATKEKGKEVVDGAKGAIKTGSEKSGYVVTTSGEMVSAVSRDYGVEVSASVDASGNVFVGSSKKAYGSVKWISDGSKKSGEYILRLPNKLMNASRTSVGYVSRKEDKGFVKKGSALSGSSTYGSDQASEILFVPSGNASVYVINGSADSVSQVAQSVADGIRALFFAGRDSLYVTFAASEASMTALSEGRSLKSSEIVLRLPLDVSKALFYNGDYYLRYRQQHNLD